MIGYKGFNENLQCRNFQYKEGETYECDELVICLFGFHFCDVPINVFNYYNQKTDKYAIIEALGDIRHKDDKFVTNKIKIVKVLTKEELIQECNDKVFKVKSGEYHFKDCKLHRDNDLPAVIDSDGTQEWFIDGLLHRDNDQPAAIFSTGNKAWYQHGKLHRDNDLPAVIEVDGTQKWYQHGKLHRDNDQPAIIWSTGSREWYQNDKNYRDNDLPNVIGKDGSQQWYKDSKLHRDNDLPALIDKDGTQEWYQNGKLHRDGDQPAIIYKNGKCQWWKYDKRIDVINANVTRSRCQNIIASRNIILYSSIIFIAGLLAHYQNSKPYRNNI